MKMCNPARTVAKVYVDEFRTDFDDRTEPDYSQRGRIECANTHSFSNRFRHATLHSSGFAEALRLRLGMPN